MRAHDRPGLEASLPGLYLCFYLDTAKRLITLHLGWRAGLWLFEALLQHAEAVISNHAASPPASSPRVLQQIHTCIRPFWH